MTEGGKLHWALKLGPLSFELYAGPLREETDEDEEKKEET